MKNPVAVTLLSALSICGAAYLSVAGNVPSLWSPFSVFAAVPAIVVYEWGTAALGWSPAAKAAWRGLATLPVGAAFLVWSYPLFRGRDRAPFRSVALALASVVLSVAYFVYAWADGMTYQGRAHTIAMAAYNLVSIGVVFWLFRRNRASPSAGSNLAFHTTLFLWLAYCAFPWLGELL